MICVLKFVLCVKIYVLNTNTWTLDHLNTSTWTLDHLNTNTFTLDHLNTSTWTLLNMSNMYSSSTIRPTLAPTNKASWS